MVQSYSMGNKIYSVDMMLAYININKPKSINVKITTMLNFLKNKRWRNQNTHYSPMDVIENPKKYKDEMSRIENVELSYPIILDGNNLVDGAHRLTKAYLNNKDKILAYRFTKTQMENFLINKVKNWDKVNKLKPCDLIKLYYERFT